MTTQYQSREEWRADLAAVLALIHGVADEVYADYTAAQRHDHYRRIAANSTGRGKTRRQPEEQR
jgi:hypothetical protein